jgi:hypothetical protein
MAAPVVAPAPMIDVELVPAAAAKVPPPSGMRLSRRDMLVFGLGVGAGAVAAVVGCFLALRSRSP